MGQSIRAESRSIERDREVGSFELRLLATINMLRSEAWGSKLQQELSKQIGREVAIGQLYLSLNRLEAKGLIASDLKGPEPIRGGRSKKVFRLETSGVRALEKTATVLNAPGVLRRWETSNEQPAP